VNDSEPPLKPRGSTAYDFKAMTDADFDRMCFRLIHLEFPDAIKPAEVGDGGADALLPKPGGGYARAWQAKHYPAGIKWGECKKSLADALKNYHPDRYTFCFPRPLTKRELGTFDKHFRNAESPIPVDHWNSEELAIRLGRSPEGLVIARHFFADDSDQLEAIKRAAIAKRSLDTPSDALEHLRPAGELLASSDPYFSYPAAVYREGGPEMPVAEDAVMSITQSEGGIVSRLDVVPNDEEAMELYAPEGKMILSADQYRQIGAALKRGESFSAKDIELSWQQLPPALQDDVGKTFRGTVTIGPSERPPPPNPWDARVIAKHGNERASIELNLRPTEPPPEWEGCLEGHFAGLTMRMLFRRHATGGEVSIKYHYTLGSAPAREQLKALRFMDQIARPGGTMTVVDRTWSEREMILQTGAPDDVEPLAALTAFLESVVEVEVWTGKQIPIDSEKFTTENFLELATVTAALRRGGFNILLHDSQLSVPPENMENIRSGGPMVIRRELRVNVLGQAIDLGTSQIDVPGYTYEELGTDPQGNHLIRLTPEGDSPAKLLERIERSRATKPPPPPPRRKRSKRRGRGKRRGGRSRG
jgi:hypothetical protein